MPTTHPLHCINILANIDEGIITTGVAGDILTFNPGSEKLFGRSADEMIGKNVSLLFDKYDGYAVALEQHLKSTSGTRPKQEEIVFGLHKDGHDVPLALSFSSFDEDGKKVIICSIRDGTEREKIRLEHEQLIGKLTESNTEFERFAYVASHDMQEPLRAMSSFSEIIATEYEPILDDEGKLYLRLIRDAAGRMQTMVVDLLEYARVGKEQDPFILFEAQEQYENVLENLATSIARRKAIIESSPLPQIHGNPVQYLRLLQNLIGNSLKYCATTVTPIIKVQVIERADHWQFDISDNGIGIDEKNALKIFEPFKRLHNREKYAGTGLGLSVCRKIVENHGGKIWCQPRAGEGSLFCFTWPKAPIH